MYIVSKYCVYYQSSRSKYSVSMVTEIMVAVTMDTIDDVILMTMTKYKVRGT